MSANKNYYQLLEINWDADTAALKQAYRKLARTHHPDMNHHDEAATLKFQEIQQAYAVLSDPLKRRAYDVELRRSGFHMLKTDSFEDILKQSKDLFNYTRSVDSRQINSDALADYVLGLLNEDHINTLIQLKDAQLQEDICTYILSSCQSIISPRLYTPIADKLMPVFGEGHHFRQYIQDELDARIKKEKQNRLVPFWAIGIVCLFTLLMWLLIK